MSLFVELKRRNVFRVAAFYAVSAWLILQVADVMFGVLRLPDWTLTFVAALLALGFPLAVTFSWIYELTPEGIKKESEIDRSQSVTPQTGKRLDRLIIIGLIVVIAVLLVERFLGDPGAAFDRERMSAQPAAETPSAGHRAASRSVPGRKPAGGSAASDLSIAVLPFANLSSDEENEYFADGLTEELLNALAQIEALKVAGRTSSFYFKGKTEDLKTIGAQLSVGHVLEGSVRKAGDRVRITAQLIKVDDGFHLWSDTYDRDLADIFQVQEEISAAIAEALKIELGLEATGAERLTEDLEAYEMYLEAKARVSTRDGLDRAIGLLRKIVEMDPGFAEAWATLGQAYALGPYYALGTFEENQPLVLEATDRALALKPNLASALTARADTLRDSNQWEAAERLYLKALEESPDEVETNSQYAQFLGRAGYLAEALPFSRKARELDPLAAIQNAVYGWNLVLLGEQETAEKALKRSLELKPDFDLAMLMLYRHHLLAAQLAEAEIYMVDRLKVQGASKTLINAARQASALTRAGNTDEALAQIETALLIAERELIGERFNYAEPLGDLAILNGDLELAIELYDRLSIFEWASFHAPVRNLEKWKERVRESGALDFWRERGWPDLCRPVGEDDFECD